MTVDEALAAIAEDAIAAVRKSLVIKPDGALPPYGVLVNADATLMMPFTFLDITQRYAILRKSVRDKQATGFVFLWEGFVDLPQRTAAVLVVSACATQAKGWAIPFERSAFGMRLYETQEVPAALVESYRKVFEEDPSARVPAVPTTH